MVREKYGNVENNKVRQKRNNFKKEKKNRVASRLIKQIC